jgi:glycosyltransferase involved in cell wall biosynthesis
MYQYILGHQNATGQQYSYHIVTEEQAAYALSSEEQTKIQAALKEQDLFWHPMPYRGGKFILFKKLWNFISLFFKIWGIKRREKTKVIVGFLAIAGGYAYIISRILRLKLMVFCFEPHSLYMKEFGIWSGNSLKYKILSKVEHLQATRADYVTGPTIHTIELLKEWKSSAKLFRVPISVDTEKFTFSTKDRQRIRTQYNIPEDRYALLYLGKFNGIYYKEKEVAEFCKRLVDFDSRIFIFTISPTPSEEVEKAYLEAGLASSDFLVLNKIPYDEIEGYISACDMGMVAIPPLDSQKYRTPVKIGNYLACGIPFLLNRGIADDDIMAEEENVGVVFESLDASDFSIPFESLKQFMQEDTNKLQARCRAAAIKHRGIQNSVEVLEKMIQEVY